MCMNTVMTQIKINLPVALKNKIKMEADELGMTLASYIRYLIVEDIKREEISDEVRKRLEDAVMGRSKSIKVKNVSDFLAKL